MQHKQSRIAFQCYLPTRAVCLSGGTQQMDATRAQRRCLEKKVFARSPLRQTGACHSGPHKIDRIEPTQIYLRSRRAHNGRRRNQFASFGHCRPRATGEMRIAFALCSCEKLSSTANKCHKNRLGSARLTSTKRVESRRKRKLPVVARRVVVWDFASFHSFSLATDRKTDRRTDRRADTNQIAECKIL